MRGVKRTRVDSFRELWNPFTAKRLALLEVPMSKETPKDEPRRQTDGGSHSQTSKPWKGNPEKEQRNDDAELDLEKWQTSDTH